MTIFSRIRRTRINYLCHQFKRCYFQIAVPSLPDQAPLNKLTAGLFHHPKCVVHRRPGEIFDNARFFAAPVQVTKKVEKGPTGPRLNDQINAQEVRLVTDEGHSVVSLREALQRAQELGQDLVEVQRGDPCVVRIMDYHKERYMKQLKEKDKVKNKSVVTLRKGSNKEVRFSPKCEEKDLKMKADTTKRLMERGYRVQCMVMGTEDQELGGMLSRFMSLIEDVAVVESGPRVERKQAYVIVRHEKFGPSKKGGKKASKAAMTGSSGSKETNIEDSESSEADEASTSQEHDSPSPTKHDKDRWSISDSCNSGENMFDYSGDSKDVHSGSMDHQLRNTREPPHPLSSAQSQPEMENRYRRQGGPQVGPNHGQGQWNNNRVNPNANGARPRAGGWVQGSDGHPGPRWAPRVNTRGDPRLNQGMNNEAGQDARDPRLNQGMNNQAGQDVRDPRVAFNKFSKPEGHGGASNQSTTYGMFSASNRNAAVGPNNRAASSVSPPNTGSRTSPPDQGSPISRTEGGNQDGGRWGIFSREDTDSKEEQGFNSQTKVHQR